MSIFVKPEDTFTVSVVIGELPDDPSIVLLAPTIAELLKDTPDAVKVEEHTLTFRFPNYKDNTSILDDSVIQSGGSFQFKTGLLRMNRLKALLKAWSFKDEKGEPIAISDATIGVLHPLVASYVNNEIDEVVGIM